MRKARNRRNSLVYIPALFLAVALAGCARIGLSKRPYQAVQGNGAIALSSGKMAELSINESFASVKDCYLFDKSERREICSYVDKAWKDMGLPHQRSMESLEAELSLHKACYLLGIEKDKAKDAELEIREDPRWCVRAASKAFEVFGL